MGTEHENAFFKQSNRILEYWVTGKGEIVSHTYFESLVEELHGEIINNCTIMAEDERAKYISRIERRLKEINDKRPVSPDYIKEIGLDLWFDLDSHYKYILKKLEDIKALYYQSGTDDKNKYTLDNKPSLRAIALKYAIEGKIINSDNNNAIAERYGHSSGHKLQQFYNYFIQPINRYNDPGTLRKLNAQVSAYDEVVEIIDYEYLSTAMDEYTNLSKILKKYES